jgi:NAD(P)H-dependent FMN reductase
MLTIAIISGSVSQEKTGEAVSEWVLDLAKQRKDAEFELLDIQEFETSRGDTQKWAQKISAFDGFIFVTPENERQPSSSLMNIFTYLKNEWKNKVAGFVGYGNNGGVMAIEHLCSTMEKLQITDVSAKVSLKIPNNPEDENLYVSVSPYKKILYNMIDQVIYWGEAMKKVRMNTAINT